jgi:hypothetical protein
MAIMLFIKLRWFKVCLAESNINKNFRYFKLLITKLLLMILKNLVLVKIFIIGKHGLVLIEKMK